MGTSRAVRYYSSQTRSDVALDAAANFVVEWTSGGQGVNLRRFAADRSRLTLELPANTRTTGNQNAPVIAMDADGDFVVAWASDGQDGSSTGIYAQSFLGPGCYGEPLEALYTDVASGTRLDWVSYSAISTHHLRVAAGAEAVLTAPSTGVGPGTVAEFGAMMKAGP